MKQKMIEYYSAVAKRTAELSYAEKKKVGAIVVKDDRIISIGYNGMPAGWDNQCEEWINVPDFVQHPDDVRVYGKPITREEVLHAESNAIAKLAKSSESGEGATMFVTHTPCMECAKLIYQAGIDTVYYSEEYKPSKGSGLSFLKASGVEVHYVEDYIQTLEER